MMLENALKENVMENWNIEDRFVKRQFLKRELHEKWSFTNKSLAKLFNLKYEHKWFCKIDYAKISNLPINWGFTTLPVILMLTQSYKFTYWTNVSTNLLNKIYSSDSWMYVDMYMYINTYQNTSDNDNFYPCPTKSTIILFSN